MFGRRRHAAKVAEVPAPVPQLSEAQILRIVEENIAALIGSAGRWSVTPRSIADTDAIFADYLAQSVSHTITAELMDARTRLVRGEAPVEVVANEGAHVAPEASVHHIAPREEAVAAEDDTAPAFTWEPAPITRWADLRRPVTGQIAVIGATKPAQERSAA